GGVRRAPGPPFGAGGGGRAGPGAAARGILTAPRPPRHLHPTSGTRLSRGMFGAAGRHGGAAMAKSGEIDYLRNLGAQGVRHAVDKPFSDPGCGRYLAEMGATLALLPPRPARLLDLGCGTGWTSVFFARAGYDVVGLDIAPDMVAHARDNAARAGLDGPEFVACDYEEMDFDGEFDAAVFFDALHHAVDEAAAVRGAYRALRPGGVCVTSEPGEGHHQSPAAREAVRKYNVTEKEMPPRRGVELGRRGGAAPLRASARPPSPAPTPSPAA